MPHAVVTTHIDAPAHAVFALVADPMRMGEWSPETARTTWRGGATGAAVGATFRGHNVAGSLKWSTDATIVELDSPEQFAFEVKAGPIKVARWGYEIAPDADGAGCVVSETWVERRPAAFRVVADRVAKITDRKAHNVAGMTETLARLKAAAEKRRV